MLQYRKKKQTIFFCSQMQRKNVHCWPTYRPTCTRAMFVYPSTTYRRLHITTTTTTILVSAHFLKPQEVIYVQFDALMYIGIGELNTLDGLCQPTFGVKKFSKVGKPILQEFFITFYYEQVLCCLSITCTNITYLKKDITAFECASIIIFFNNLRSSFYKGGFLFQL